LEKELRQDKWKDRIDLAKKGKSTNGRKEKSGGVSGVIIME